MHRFLGVISLVAVCVVVITVGTSAESSDRSFTISPRGDHFVRDGKPFRIISGSMHYFRSLPSQWDSRMQLMVAAGLNAIQTVVPWNFHCPSVQSQCDFSGEKNITQFFDLAAKHELLVVLRPGPYICAEWDFGGFPAWLIKENITLPVRSSDASYMKHVTAWWAILLPLLRPYLYINGGPVVMMQIENEYGSFGDNKVYLRKLRDLCTVYLGANSVILHSTDGHSPMLIERTAIEGVFQTVDFGVLTNVTAAWAAQDSQADAGKSRKGPHFNSEFYPGWLTKWNDTAFRRVSIKEIVQTLKCILVNSSTMSNVNFYMFFGGTNYGFWSGLRVVTSYDYDSPISEDGRPNPEKYEALRALIPTFYPPSQATDIRRRMHRLSQRGIPVPPAPVSYGTVNFIKYFTMYVEMDLRYLASTLSYSDVPLSMEQLGQSYGCIAYEFQGAKQLLSITLNPLDYALVYVDDAFEGTLINGLNSTIRFGTPRDVRRVLVLIDSFGRCNYGACLWSAAKGLTSAAKYTTSDGSTFNITGYNIYTLPLERPAHIPWHPISKASAFPPQPGLMLLGFFNTSAAPTAATFLDMRLWGKGIVMVNGHNLGRFWSVVGPQYSLYCPHEFLNSDGMNNEVVITELASVPTVRSTLPLSATNYNQ